VELRIPCGPKLSAKEHVDRERELAQVRCDPIVNVSVAGFKTPPGLENGRSAATNIGVLSWLQKRKDTLELRTLATNKEPKKSGCIPGGAQGDEKFHARVGHRDEGCITSYPTPE
jgi:hypothetical protein